MNQINVIGRNELECCGVQFLVIDDDFEAHRTTSERVVVLKGPLYFEFYANLIRKNDVSSVLELGIWQGGSAILLALMFPHLKIVAIDIAEPNWAIHDWIDRLRLRDRLKLYFGTSQDDEAAIQSIMGAELPDGVDLVIDDASHFYEMSLRSFEIIFPRLRPLGHYVVEDWAWAHHDGDWQTNKWVAKPALTNLIFKLVMLLGSRPDQVTEMTLMRYLCMIRKVGGYQAKAIELDSLILARGRTPSLI